jgi:hypothetical protein
MYYVETRADNSGYTNHRVICLVVILEKKIALCVAKKIDILTLVLSEKKFLNETKNHNPPPSS